MNDLISVIVPVYNVEKYLNRCVSSIIEQSYKNLEIILVDDGSSDSSPDICDHFKLVDNRIIVIHKENGGLSSARNCGMEYANGVVLAFIDSDDFIHKDFFKVMMDARSLTKADIVSTDIYKFSNESDIKVSTTNTDDYLVLENIKILQEYFAPEKESQYIYHGLCMKIYNKELFDNLYFENGRLHEDLFITYKLLDNARRFCFVKLPYYFYCQSNTESICNNFSRKNYFDTLTALNNTEEYFKDNVNIRSHLTNYLVSMYLDLICRGQEILDKEIDQSIHLLRKKIRKSIKYDKQRSFIKRCGIWISMSNMRLFNILRKLS